jgi:hypothetical protein
MIQLLLACELWPVANTSDLFSLFGFLLGTAGTGAGMYYYVLDEYKVSNELLTEDIYVSFPYKQKEKGGSASNVWLMTGY